MPDLHLEVSPLLRSDFENGRTYYPLHGTEVIVPAAAALRPDAALLGWHVEHVYRS
jgi:hypothetical protein